MERLPVDVTALTAALGERWARIEVVDEVESTNARLLADAGAPDRSVLVAEVQTAGRGRLDRTWLSPPRAGLTFSVLVRPAAPIATWGWLPLLTGVAVHDAVPGVLLKWPNDVLCGRDERKLAGILAQTSGEAVVLGVGLNVSTTAEELPVDTATSLALCGSSELDRTELLVAVLDRLDRRLAQWADVGGDAAGVRPARGLLGGVCHRSAARSRWRPRAASGWSASLPGSIRTGGCGWTPERSWEPETSNICARPTRAR